ncbi:hypothetical protein TIFTF001_038402 [Ficus carica]|uniref:NB-ARC domain-containing protein n=1 Tax=Ficus carica TaxID=3494 RepID=A0AA88JDR3_FICCA|nr:hypothetical protein TIFTF001_038402 [Ficus carica]
MQALEDEKFRRIGFWGIGGARKTTLVTNLNNKLKSCLLKQPFSIVLWATVTNVLEMKKTQIQIAEILNLEVKMEDCIQRTASRLFERQERERERKFVLILDDGWEKIDSDSLGVPQPENHAPKITMVLKS